MENKQENSKITKNKYMPTAAFYSQIIDSLQDYSIFTLDQEFVINSWSSGAAKIFGYETDEVIGESFELIFTDEDLKNGVPKKEIETALKEGRATDNRWHIAKDKSLFYAYGLVFPLIGLEGEMLGYVKILRDLTERKHSEDAIKKYVKEGCIKSNINPDKAYFKFLLLSNGKGNVVFRLATKEIKPDSTDLRKKLKVLGATEGSGQVQSVIADLNAKKYKCVIKEEPVKFVMCYKE